MFPHRQVPNTSTTSQQLPDLTVLNNQWKFPGLRQQEELLFGWADFNKVWVRLAHLLPHWFSWREGRRLVAPQGLGLPPAPGPWTGLGPSTGCQGSSPIHGGSLRSRPSSAPLAVRENKAALKASQGVLWSGNTTSRVFLYCHCLPSPPHPCTHQTQTHWFHDIVAFQTEAQETCLAGSNRVVSLEPRSLTTALYWTSSLQNDQTKNKGKAWGRNRKEKALMSR